MLIFSLVSSGQSLNQLVLSGDYTRADSVQIIEAYLNASDAAGQMGEGMAKIWKVNPENGDRNQLRKQRWTENPAFVKWLGPPEHIRLAKRKIRKIVGKFEKKITLVVTKDNRGRCHGWISAWAIPFGKVKIRLCEDFFFYRTHLQEKVIVHEMGHESGILFHRKIHGCRAAGRAARSDHNIAKRSTENYAWLAMSYLGKECSR